MKKLLLLLLAGSISQAASIDWSGTYRFELMEVNKPSLQSHPSLSKSYGLHFLTLRPRILASDGISIFGRFDLLTNTDPAYANSQIGQMWGGTGFTAASTDGSANNTLRENQIKSEMMVRELYMQVEEENGALLLGRAPYEFGLGITHNAGNGLFDHWYDNKDMIAYKFYVGNLSFMPMLARTYDRDGRVGATSQEQLIEVMYDNKDAGATLGLLFERKNSASGVVADAANTGWRDALCNGGAGCVGTGSNKYERTNFFLARQWESFGFKLEGGFAKGKTGVYTNGGQVEINSYGIASEMKYKKADSKWGYNLNLGVASGNNPGSTKFEGYQFDRNYDIAMLLFNHRLGQIPNMLGTNVIKDSAKNAGNSLDDEAISNAGYINFKVDHDWKERWKFNYSLTYAQMMDKSSVGSNMKKDLGMELDAGITYFPREKVQWVNQVGVLMPGEAFKNGTGAGGNLKNDTVIGLSSKAAISF